MYVCVYIYIYIYIILIVLTLGSYEYSCSNLLGILSYLTGRLGSGVAARAHDADVARRRRDSERAASSMEGFSCLETSLYLSLSFTLYTRINSNSNNNIIIL